MNKLSFNWFVSIKIKYDWLFDGSTLDKKYDKDYIFKN